MVDQLHTGRYYSSFLVTGFVIPVKELEAVRGMRPCGICWVSIGLELRLSAKSARPAKQALTAQDAGTTWNCPQSGFLQALTFAKRMHDTYRINDRPISIGLTAIQELDRIRTKKIAVIGLGEIISW